MDSSKRTALMHAVLDGEASSAEAAQLTRLLDADPAARAEFEELQGVFAVLKDVKSAYPPEGLYAAVMSGLPPAHAGPRQLSEVSRVIDPIKPSSTDRSRNSSTSRRPLAPETHIRGHHMSEQQKMSSGKRKVALIGVGVALIAGVLVATSGTYFPSATSDTTGAIVPAQRFRAPQPTSDVVRSDAQPESARAPEAGAGGASDGRVNQLQDGRVNQMQDGRVNQLQDGRVNQLQDGRMNQMQDGRVNQMQDGRVNQLQDGRVNQLQDGRVNQLQDGRVNQMQDGRVNQMQDGRVNQMQDGRVNQMQDGRVNQMQDGRVNQMQDGRVNQMQDGRVNGMQDGLKASDGRAAPN